MKSEEVSLMKGFGILFIVSGHALVNWGAFPPSAQILIFFWAAGWTYHFDKYSNNVGSLIGSRIHRFMMPYLGYMVLFLLLHNVYCDTGILPDTIKYVSLNEYIIAFLNCLTLNCNQILFGPTWFMAPYLEAIAFWGIIIYLMNLIYKKESMHLWWWVLLVSSFCALVGLYLIETNNPTGYHYELALLMLPVLTLGKIVSLNYEELSKYFNVLGAVFSLWVIEGGGHGKVINLGSNEIISPWFFWCVVLSAIYLVMWLVKLCSGLCNNFIKKTICVLGNYSMDIMILHITFFRLLYVVFNFRKGDTGILDYKAFVSKFSVILLMVGLIGPIFIRMVFHMIYIKILRLIRE